jgi:hypothetical protein
VNDLSDEPEVRRVMHGVAFFGIPATSLWEKVTPVYRTPGVEGFDFKSGNTCDSIFALTLNKPARRRATEGGAGASPVHAC